MRDGPIWRALRDMASLVRDVRQRRFDVVVDFHSFRETQLLTRLSGAPIRIGLKRHNAPYLGFCFNKPPIVEDKNLHVLDMFQKVVEGVVVEIRDGRMSQQSPVISAGKRPSALGRIVVEKAKNPTLALYVDAPAPERIWPPERFAQVADYAIEQLGASVIVISGPQGTHLASRIQKASRNANRLSIFTDLTLAQLAETIASARMLISNDTGPMHIGPSVGVLTLGLFSVGLPEHFRPRGAGDRLLRANPIELIRAEDVIETMVGMWTTADRDLRR
jgi:ADP-heptose:LPS heptosyltransferase